MRLLDLDPNWWIEGEGRRGLGVLFQCPVHPGGACHVGVPFANPLDGGPRAARGGGEDGTHYWARTGDTFASLTLSPSIHVQDLQPDKTKTTHWHGWITDGEVR